MALEREEFHSGTGTLLRGLAAPEYRNSASIRADSADSGPQASIAHRVENGCDRSELAAAHLGQCVRKTKRHGAGSKGRKAFEPCCTDRPRRDIRGAVCRCLAIFRGPCDGGYIAGYDLQYNRPSAGYKIWTLWQRGIHHAGADNRLPKLRHLAAYCLRRSRPAG